VAWLSRFSNAAITRTTGADLFLPLASAAADAALPVYLFGSSTPVLDAASLAMRNATRGRIKIAGLVSPSVNFDPSGPEADAAMAAITASGAGICYVLLKRLPRWLCVRGSRSRFCGRQTGSRTSNFAKVWLGMGMATDEQSTTAGKTL
jgi:hypothetical protein